MIKVVELLIESWPKMDLGDVRNGWPAKITLAYDDGADGLEIVQSGREPAGVVRNANEEWSLDGWIEEEEEIARCRSYTTSPPHPFLILLHSL